jgi:hypothetical protein
MMDTKIAVQGQVLTDILNQRLSSSAVPTPVAWVYDANSDLYLRIMLGGVSPAAVLKFELHAAIPAGQTDGVGAAQRVYTPHILKVGFDSGVQASGTATLTAAVATNAVTINGVAFTAVAAGAVGNQFNVGANDTATAANLAASINASVTAGIVGVVTASSVANVVTIKAVSPGTAGNQLTLTGTGAPVVVSGAKLAGGVVPQTTDDVQSIILAETARIGVELRIYGKGAIDTADLNVDANLLTVIRDFNWGRAASV